MIKLIIGLTLLTLGLVGYSCCTVAGKTDDMTDAYFKEHYAHFENKDE